MISMAIEEKALEELNQRAAGHSKSTHLIKNKLSRELYLEDNRFSQSEVHLLFSLKTRSIDVKKNYSNHYRGDVYCRTCLSTVEIESQRHLMYCNVLLSTVPVPNDVDYEDLFSDTDKQLRIVRIYKLLLRER